MRDAVHDDGVVRSLVEMHRAGLDELSVNAFHVTRIDVLDKRAGKAVFHAKEYADFFHARQCLPSPVSL